MAMDELDSSVTVFPLNDVGLAVIWEYSRFQKNTLVLHSENFP